MSFSSTKTECLWFLSVEHISDTGLRVLFSQSVSHTLLPSPAAEARKLKLQHAKVQIYFSLSHLGQYYQMNL